MKRGINTYGEDKFSSPYAEMYNAAMAVATWCKEMTGHLVLITLDCLPMTQACNKHFSPEHDIMTLIRSIYRAASIHSFDVRFAHLPRSDPLIVPADHLSRSQVKEFLASVPKLATCSRTTPSRPELLDY